MCHFCHEPIERLVIYYVFELVYLFWFWFIYWFIFVCFLFLFFLLSIIWPDGNVSHCTMWWRRPISANSVFLIPIGNSPWALSFRFSSFLFLFFVSYSIILFVFHHLLVFFDRGVELQSFRPRISRHHQLGLGPLLSGGLNPRRAAVGVYSTAENNASDGRWCADS
jgi:hypothetical protein